MLVTSEARCYCLLTNRISNALWLPSGIHHRVASNAEQNDLTGNALGARRTSNRQFGAINAQSPRQLSQYLLCAPLRCHILKTLDNVHNHFDVEPRGCRRSLVHDLS